VNNETVSTETKYTFTASRDVELKANFEILTSSVRETGKGMDIYPNPANNKLYLNFSQTGSKEIQLIDSVGRAVYSKLIANQNECIDLFRFTPGIYILKVRISGNTYSRKIVIGRKPD
jgi:hypothetical protein